MHDLEYDSAYIYFEEDYYNNPKEIFKFVAKSILEHTSSNKPQSLLDVGCARGEFIYYLLKQYPEQFTSIMGVDLLEELISSAKAFDGLKDIDFQCVSCDSYTIGKHFDVITMLGLISALANIKQTFANAALHQKTGGKLFVFSRFNHTDADVKVYYENRSKKKDWQVTATHSIHTIKDISEQCGYKIVDLLKFELPFELEEREDDPLRSWTIRTENGTKFINGLGLIFDLELMILEKI